MVQQLRSFFRQCTPALVMLLVLTVVCGVVYPLLVTGVAQVAFHDKADGSLIKKGDTVIGSSLLGQGFAAPKYFHPRPSAAGAGYDAAASGASNMGPTNPDYLKTVAERVTAYRSENGLSPQVDVPADAVQASSSGLDPDISIANARLQAPRVAKERNMAVKDVMSLIDEHTDQRPLGVLGDPGVNVLALNLALDQAG